MTFPTVVSSATSSESTNTTTHTVSMPSGIVAGNTLVGVITFDARPIASGEIPDNWVFEIGQADGGDHAITVVYWALTFGTEGSTAEILTDVAQCSAHRVYQISGLYDIESIGTEPSSAGSTGDPASLALSTGVAQDVLWIALLTIDNGTSSITAYPSSYSNTGIVNAGDATDGVSLGYATRELNAASEDPGAFTIDSSQFYSTITLGLRPRPLVAWVATGTKSAGNATATSIAYPSGISAGRMVLAGRSGWRSDITMANESGWTNTAELGGGTGTSVDNHSTKIRVDRKELTGSESGSVTFDQSGSTNPGCLGIMVNYEKPSGYTWDVATSTGDDATHGSNRSVTGSSSISFQQGDVLVAFAATDTDTSLASFSSPALTASGITFGTTTRRTSGAGVNTGDDGNIEVFEATVSSGSGTVAPALAFTTTTSQCGPVAFVRLRAVSAGTNASAANASGTGAASTAASSVTPSAGSPTGAGSAPTAGPNVRPNAGAATGQSAAQPATTTISSTINAAAGAGAAPQPTPALGVNTGNPNGAGSAFPATVSTAANTQVSAGSADGAGTAGTASTSITATCGAATGAATAGAAAPSVAVHPAPPGAAGAAFGAAAATQAPAGLAEGTGTAAVASISLAPTAGAATSTSAAGSPAPSIAVSPSSATSAGAALQAAASTASFVNANAGVADGSGAASAAAASVAVAAGAPTASGVAGPLASSTTASAGVGAGMGAAAAASASLAASAGPSSGSGTAGQSAPSVAVTTAAATGAGTGLQASANTSSAASAAAGVAVSTGTANPPAASIRANAAVGTAAGGAEQASSSAAASPSAALGAGSANGAVGSSSRSASADAASGFVLAWGPTAAISSGAPVAEGAGQAWPAVVIGDSPDPNPAPISFATVGSVHFDDAGASAIRDHVATVTFQERQ